MKKSRLPMVSIRVRQLCQQISREADRDKLRSLTSRLQEAIKEDQGRIPAASVFDETNHDNPFDKVLLG